MSDYQNIEAAFQHVREWVLQVEDVIPDPQYVMRSRYGISYPVISERLEAHDWSQEKELTELAEFSYYRRRRLFKTDGMALSLPFNVLALVQRQLYDATDHGVQTPHGTTFEILEPIVMNKIELSEIYAEWLLRGDSVGKLQRLKTELDKNMENPLYDQWTERHGFAFNRAATLRQEIFQKHLAALLPADEYTEARELNADLQHALYENIWEQGFDLYRRYNAAMQPITFKHYDSAGNWRHPYPFKAAESHNPKNLVDE